MENKSIPISKIDKDLYDKMITSGLYPIKMTSSDYPKFYILVYLENSQGYLLGSNEAPIINENDTLLEL